MYSDFSRIKEYMFQPKDYTFYIVLSYIVQIYIANISGYCDMRRVSFVSLLHGTVLALIIYSTRYLVSYWSMSMHK